MIQITLQIERELVAGLDESKGELIFKYIEQDGCLLSPDKYSKVHGLLSEIAKCISEPHK